MFGFFKKTDVHLCPEIKGRLTLNGEPLSGVQITRSLCFKDEKPRVDSTTSDPEGAFSFPEVNIQTRNAGGIFSVESTLQEIAASHDNQTYLIWLSAFPSIVFSKEYAIKLHSLDCELLNKPVKFTFRNDSNNALEHTACSICRWQSDFTVIRDL